MADIQQWMVGLPPWAYLLHMAACLTLFVVCVWRLSRKFRRVLMRLSDGRCPRSSNGSSRIGWPGIAPIFGSFRSPGALSRSNDQPSNTYSVLQRGQCCNSDYTIAETASDRQDRCERCSRIISNVRWCPYCDGSGMTAEGAPDLSTMQGRMEAAERSIKARPKWMRPPSRMFDGSD